MPSLADILLSGRPAVRPIHPSTALRGRLAEAAKFSKPIQLSAAEARAVQALLEKMDADPFASSGPSNFMTASDMRIVGLKPGVDYQPDQQDTSGSDASRPGADRNQSGLIGAEMAIVAPSATPGGCEDIPASVLATLSVLQAPDSAKPISSIQVEPASAAPESSSHGEGPIPTSMPTPSLPPEAEAAVVEGMMADREAAIRQRLAEHFAGDRPAVPAPAPTKVPPAPTKVPPAPGVNVDPVDFVRTLRSNRQRKQTGGGAVTPGGGGARTSTRRTPASNVLPVLGESTSVSDEAVAAARRKAAALGFDD